MIRNYIKLRGKKSVNSGSIGLYIHVKIHTDQRLHDETGTQMFLSSIQVQLHQSGCASTNITPLTSLVLTLALPLIPGALTSEAHFAEFLYKINHVTHLRPTGKDLKYWC